jgi:hypothetical protein
MWNIKSEKKKQGAVRLSPLQSVIFLITFSNLCLFSLPGFDLDFKKNCMLCGWIINYLFHYSLFVFIVLHSEGIGNVTFLVDSYTEYLKREKILINPLVYIRLLWNGSGETNSLVSLKVDYIEPLKEIANGWPVACCSSSIDFQ